VVWRLRVPFGVPRIAAIACHAEAVCEGRSILRYSASISSRISRPRIISRLRCISGVL